MPRRIYKNIICRHTKLNAGVIALAEDIYKEILGFKTKQKGFGKAKYRSWVVILVILSDYKSFE